MLTEKDQRCKAKTTKGKPCGAAPTAGGLCFFHANPQKASELGRLGGNSKRHIIAETLDPLPPLDNAKSVLEFVVRLSQELYSGKLSPKIAASFPPMIHLLLRSIEATDCASRISHLENIIARSDVRPAVWDDSKLENEYSGGS